MNEKGTLNKETEFFEILNSNEKITVKYIKPILTDGICLSCHGSKNNISDEVTEVLTKKYPNDKAVGFKIGDLRGIISISKEID